MNLPLYFENRETIGESWKISIGTKRGRGRGGSAPSLVTVAIIIINIIN